MSAEGQEFGVTVDLNADLGEGFGIWTLGDDAGLLEVVTSANVACGFHAGDPSTMRRVCAEAVGQGVTIGAQVGYRDLAGFGRRAIDIASADLAAEVVYQIGALDAFARLAGSRVRYVKPHGALYNTAAVDERQADAVASAVASVDPGLLLLGLAGSALADAAAAHSLVFVAEAFADRAYSDAGLLVGRDIPGAVLTETADVITQALAIVCDGQVTTIGGNLLPIRARSLCLHGDTPGAVELARSVRAALTDVGVEIRAFAQ
jgi:UPF0271 protein